MPSNKRPAEEAEDSGGYGAIGNGYGNGDTAGSVRKKSATSTRTGQACDRCKIRKIRCDARPGGCSPCLQNNTDCKTTDRITGRATARGHAEHLENENAGLRMYMVELQQQLRESGVDPKPPPAHNFVPPPSFWVENEQQRGSWGDLSSSGVHPGSQDERHGSQGSLLPEFRSGCIGDNYLGVTGNDWLSPIEGTQLTLFGMKIDLAEFLLPEDDPTSEPLSYKRFLRSAFMKNDQRYVPPLPVYEVCRKLAEWYFKSVQVFIPALHKPDFMRLLSRIYHGHYQPNAAETVMVHMVLTIMNFQKALRNGDEQARLDAMNHYHYSLGFVPELIAGHQLQDIQALSVICAQLRSQPRVGAAWMFINMVLGLAMELGLHRTANAWQADGAERDPHTIEMRKRVFWSILLIHVNLSGKLGRPMPLRLEDFDIEIPEHVNDSLPGEVSNSKWGRCSFRAAIPGIKLTKILMQVYATVYSIRSGHEPYEMSIRSLEKDLESFKSQLPPELAGDSETVGEDRIPALYLKHAEHQIHLLLHHPSLCRSMSTQVMTSNLDVCLDASRKILSAAFQLHALKSLDTTWYFVTDYLAAIFTTLFAYTQKQDQITSAELQQLRQDMDSWLVIMGDVGNMLGTGPRIRESVRSVIDTSIANISRTLAAKTASAGLASAGSPTSAIDPTQQAQMFAGHSAFSSPYVNGNSNGNVVNGAQQAYTVNNRATAPLPNSPYPPPNNFYHNPHHGPMQSYVGSFDASHGAEDMKPNLNAQLDAHNIMPSQPHLQHSHPTSQMTPQQAPTSFMAAFQPPPSHDGFNAPPQAVNLQHSGPAAWRHFADTMAPNMNAQDYMNSANALMALQADKSHGIGMNAASVAGMGGLQMPHDSQQPWPLIYNTGPVDGQ